MNKKNQKQILDKLNITKLNDMQEEASLAIQSVNDIVLLSPTGTGKTLAFLLPIVADLDPKCSDVQVLIVAPSRELAIQIEGVARNMATGYKTNVVYGGRSSQKDRIELATPPAILVGTPGRLADHLRRGIVNGESIKTIVLDEFDKSLEVGFEEDMTEIWEELPALEKRILTSATQGVEVPAFVQLKNETTVNYLEDGVAKLEIMTIESPEKDKLETLVSALSNLAGKPGIVFCNFKDSIARVSEFLDDHKISHGVFHGGMEQKDRERSLIKFRNGTHQLLLATDLAARGIDVPELKFIIHYQLPFKSEEFTHRNGRTARMNNEGTAYVLKWKQEPLADFIEASGEFTLEVAAPPAPSTWKTLFISGGRKDKISKGDIAGLFFKQGQLDRDELGTIELKTDCAFVAVAGSKVDELLKVVNNTRLKKKKVRVYEV